MGRADRGTIRLWDEPVPRDRHARDADRRIALFALPVLEIDRAGEGGQHDELRERHAGTLGKGGGRFERGRSVARQTEDERPEDVDPVFAEDLQPADQCVADQIEPLVDVLQPLGRDRRVQRPWAAVCRWHAALFACRPVGV